MMALRERKKEKKKDIYVDVGKKQTQRPSSSTYTHTMFNEE
jgi:hypothetical protein